MFRLISLIIFFVLAISATAERIEILMSNVTTQQEDAYICTSYKLKDYQNYITNIQPLAKPGIAHHMFAFGCEKPASMSQSWNCGNIVCQGSKTILFAWGRNAPALQLPEDVAFKVGQETTYKYIVVNIHYLKKVENDISGLALTVTDNPKRYQAGILLMVAGSINIPPNSKSYSTDVSCKYEGKNLNIFAYRVHAHMHGTVNAAYRIRSHEWIQLAKGDPQWPQAFYPTGLYDLKDGDALVGRCTYTNNENRYVNAGPSHTDEMCNIYLMYYADNIEGVMDVCSGNTYPQLESIIPDESTRRPSPPDTFTKDASDTASNQNGLQDSILSHHDMEGSKMHHDVNPKKNPKNNKNNQDSLSKTLSYYLNQPDEDYYDEIEKGRNKLRNNPGDQAFYDSNDLAGVLGDDSDYPFSDNALLLSAAFEKLNALNEKNSESGSNINKKKNIIKHINNLLPKSATKYTNVANWYSSTETSFGQIGGVSINQKSDSILVFHRGSQIWQMDSFNDQYQFNTRKYNVISENTIVTLDRNTGKPKGQSWGANMFYIPHGITLDSEGNTWVTDVGRHQVLKFKKGNTGRPDLEIGIRMVPGSDQKHLCQPTDVAVLKNGDFFVADGYCNSRVIKFSKNGEYLTEWSSEDKMMPSHFFVPHALALNEKANLLCVADRENYRVQCFDLNGNNLLQVSLTDFGPIYSVAFAANNASIVYAVNGLNSRSLEQLDKKILMISTVTGKVVGSINLDEEISSPHDIELSDDGTEIYVANLKPSKVFKYMLFNYKIGSKGGNGTNVVKTDKVNLDKDSFRTSMLIMGFLCFPLVIAGLVAICVRYKNMGRLNSATVNKEFDLNKGKLGKWIDKATNKKNRNGGFTRLKQDSDNDETEQLNRPSNSDSESESDEVGIKMPTLTKI